MKFQKIISLQIENILDLFLFPCLCLKVGFILITIRRDVFLMTEAVLGLASIGRRVNANSYANGEIGKHGRST